MPVYNTSSDDSDLSDSYSSSKSTFRVRVCLKRYFTDIRALCLILASRKRRVRWLERRLRKLFALKDRFCLTADGHLLPSSEPLGVLNPDDLVEVIPHSLEEQPQSCIFNNGQKEVYEKPLGEDSLDGTKCRKTISSGQCAPNVNRCNNQHRIMEPNKHTSISDNDGNKDHIMMPEDVISHDLPNVVRYQIPTPEPQPDDTLEQFKQHALNLLDLKYSDTADQSGFTDDVRPRKRRRVRRRRRPSPSQIPEAIPTDTTSPENGVECCDVASISVAESSEVTEKPSPVFTFTNGCSVAPSSSVARNEAACARKPRLIRSMEDVPV